MATRKPKENDASLPFAALQLLAPPVRLVSAALWKVMKRRDVMQYGILEEFVTSACETVPGLLTARHQGKLALGLRGRLILELCCSQPDEKMIKSHLERMRAPCTPSPSSAPTVKRDVKIQRTVESFHALIQTLLTDPAESKQFFKEEFPVDYGPNFDHELEKLLWEFLIRLDQLLPVPSLVQTVSWLGDAPTVLEECARAATQPQLLKILLQHQTCLGNLETAASLPPNMGDSILASLSLPPSGRVPSNQQTGSKQSAVDQPGGTNTTVKTPFITPVFGLISNEEVPAMISANKRRLGADEPASSKDATNENLAAEEVFKFTVVKPRNNTKDDGVNDGGEQMEEEEERGVSKRSSGLKRKQPDRRDSESDEEEEVLSRSRKERISRSLRNGTSKLTKTREGQTENGSKENQNERIEECSKAVLETCMTQLGLRLPKDPYLCSVYVSCLSNQPKVVLEKLSLICAGAANRTGREGHTSYMKQQDQRRRSPVKALTCKSMRGQSQKTHPDSPGLDDKENHPILPSISSSPSRQRTEPSSRQGDGEDYVADSEDEATKNFKGRLFMKRYYKTKHGTYVPTLREYWRPGTTRRNMLSPGSKRR